jgi:hypothetical protein
MTRIKYVAAFLLLIMTIPLFSYDNDEFTSWWNVYQQKTDAEKKIHSKNNRSYSRLNRKLKCLFPTHQPAEQPPATDFAFVESDGMVVMEAEHYNTKIDRNKHFWRILSYKKYYSGSGYIMALPDTGTRIKTDYGTKSPETIYSVMFENPGIYYVWTRAYGKHDGNNSAHAGLNNEENETANNLLFSTKKWKWKKVRMDGSDAYIAVDEPGIHTFHIWMREDGALVDKIILTRDTDYVPHWKGPDESPVIHPGSGEPTASPTPTQVITQPPTPSPTLIPTDPPPTPSPTMISTDPPPTPSPTIIPTYPPPTTAPTAIVTSTPTGVPTAVGSIIPTPLPTFHPTDMITQPPTAEPTPSWNYMLQIDFDYNFDGSISVDPPDVMGNSFKNCSTGLGAYFYYTQETNVTLEITSPDLFIQWSGDITSPDNPITITMDQDITLFADLINPIQDAIDAASYGDTILIDPGTYYQPLILKPGITLQGSGMENTILRSTYFSYPVIKAAEDCTITGFSS